MDENIIIFHHIIQYVVNEAQYYCTFKALIVANSPSLIHCPSALKICQNGQDAYTTRKEGPFPHQNDTKLTLKCDQC